MTRMKRFVYTIVPNSDGTKHYIVLTTKGEAYSWGKNNLGQLERVSTTSNEIGTHHGL
jgi:alpha-tubulin suppressor-like RCC1 family protein